MSNTGTEIAKPIRFMNPGSLDENRGPYPTIAAANLAIPNTIKGGRSLREGKFVDIGTIGDLQTYWWSGTDYADNKLVPYFQDLAKEVDFAPVKIAVNETTIPSDQLCDNKKMFESGGYNLINGSGFDSDNQLRTKNLNIDPFWLGKQMTISGFGFSQPTGAARVVIRNSNNESLLIIPGAGADYTPVTFTIPHNATYIRFGIANVIGIGINPTVNDFVDTFMVNLGSVALPVEKYGVKLNHVKVDYPMKERDQEIENRINPVIIDSVNVINFLTDFESGGYNASSGGNSVSSNQIRVKRLPVLESWKNKQMTLSGFGLLNPTGGARVVIKNANNENLLIIPGAGSDYTPVTFTMPPTAATIGFGIANIVGIGLNPQSNAFTGSLQLQLGSGADSFDKYGVSYLNLANAKNWPSNLGGFDESEIVIEKPSANFMTIYFHTGRSAANDIWFGVDFVRSVKPVSPDASTSNYDTWKLNMAHIFKRTAEYSFTILQKVILEGVWENAIYISTGYRNALGSLHGNELMEEVTFLFDGIEMLPSFEGSFKCRYVLITQRSNFTKQDSTTEFVGQSHKRWDVYQGTITVYNAIPFSEPLPIMQSSYIGMCSVIRSNSNGFQVTHTAMRDDEYKKYDVSNELFVNPLITIKNNPEHKNIVIWGDRFGVDFKIIERSANRPDAGLWVQNSELYNKIYGPGGSENVVPGKVWKTVFSVTPFVK